MISGAVFKREMIRGMRRKGQILMAPAFFVMVMALYPLAVGPDISLLAEIAPGLLIVSALLASLLSLETLFINDMDDGTLDTLAAEGCPLPLYAAGKIAAHWCLQSMPLLIVAPIIVVAMGLSSEEIGRTVLTLLPVSLLLTLTGAFGAALLTGTRQSSILLALLILPFYTPILIFGAGALLNVESTMPLVMLWALLALATPLMLLVTGAIIKGLME